jgi:hypothetical protein
MAKGATVPIPPFEIQQALTDVTVPGLVQPHHTVDPLDRTTGPHNPSKQLRHTCIGRLPLRTQTLTHDLLYHHQRRPAGVWLAVDVRHSLTQGPQADSGLASQWLRHGLSELLMHPSELLQGPLIVEQAPHLAPLLAG